MRLIPTHRASTAVPLTFALVALGAAGALAGTDTAILEVQAEVVADCTVQSSTLDFGDYIRGQAGHLDVTATIGYSNCTPGNVTFELDSGNGPNVGERFMLNGEDKLNYQIYRQNTRTNVLGQGDQALQAQILAAGGGQVVIYGRVFGDQNPPAGIYTDTLNVTLNF